MEQYKTVDNGGRMGQSVTKILSPSKAQGSYKQPLRGDMR